MEGWLGFAFEFYLLRLDLTRYCTLRVYFFARFPQNHNSDLTLKTVEDASSSRAPPGEHVRCKKPKDRKNAARMQQRGTPLIISLPRLRLSGQGLRTGDNQGSSSGVHAHAPGPNTHSSESRLPVSRITISHVMSTVDQHATTSAYPALSRLPHFTWLKHTVPHTQVKLCLLFCSLLRLSAPACHALATVETREQ